MVRFKYGPGRGFRGAWILTNQQGRKPILHPEEKAILVGLDQPGQSQDIEARMAELTLLAQTAGARVVSTLVQRRQAPDPAYYIGLGKARELADSVAGLATELVIFNDELSPSQVRNLDRLTGAKIIDRTALILDIFARRARSREGKLQVELAQMQYLLPRLTGLGNQLSRLGGGIGTRGPGETQLESDRRVIRRRIGELQQEIKALRRHRLLHRQRRRRNRQTVVSLVGYTNAGKSTLLNALTNAGLYTEDKLFATLDPSVRRGELPGGREVLFADTVGFIEHLPRSLAVAFRATLEEIAAADLLAHVVDISHPDYSHQITVVREHLSRIDPDYFQREMLVFNKTDLFDGIPNHSLLRREHPGACFVSASTGAGLEEFTQAAAEMLERGYHQVRVYLPYRETALYHRIKRHGNVLAVDYEPSHLTVLARVDPGIARQLLPYTSPPAGENAAPGIAQKRDDDPSR